MDVCQCASVPFLMVWLLILNEYLHCVSTWYYRIKSLYDFTEVQCKCHNWSIRFVMHIAAPYSCIYVYAHLTIFILSRVSAFLFYFISFYFTYFYSRSSLFCQPNSISCWIRSWLMAWYAMHYTILTHTYIYTHTFCQNIS